MKKVLSLIMTIAVILSATCVINADMTSIGPNKTVSWSNRSVIHDYNYTWYTSVTNVSFYGMPAGTHPANYELYFRPYTTENGTMAGDAVTYRYRTTNTSLPATIGYTGISQNYYSTIDPRGTSRFGTNGYEYTLKCNSNNTSLGQTISYSWTA